ncbi:MAG: AAA domain-containing protein, partial [Gammaproteobacteria bacterium]
DGLPGASRALLSAQHRMVKPIGDMISECFYEGRLKSETVDRVRELEPVLAAPVSWISTHGLPDGERLERPSGLANTSFANAAEAKAIVRFLENLNWLVQHARWADKHGGKKLTALVLSGYRPQVAAIRQRVIASVQRLGALEVEVNTVDAAQGREADISVFSVTRSNRRGDLGFLKFTPRVNVALSRGKYGLVIVGDLRFCEDHPGPLAEVASYIRSHPDNCSINEVEA